MKITFHPLGDHALLIQWEQKIDILINTQVVQLSRAIEGADFPAVQYCLPAYCSLTIGYLPEKMDYTTLCRKIKDLAENQENKKAPEEKKRRITIPVCYQGDFAPDLEWMSSQIGLSPEQIVQLHTATTFRVYMLGFLPGFAYLGTLPKVLRASRKETPRLRVPAGSVALAGLQTGIYPFESPGGWQIIGRTPLKVFDPEREQPFLIRAGDEVRFEAIDQASFQELSKKQL